MRSVIAINPFPSEPGPNETVPEQLKNIRNTLRVQAALLVWLILQTGGPVINAAASVAGL